MADLAQSSPPSTTAQRRCTGGAFVCPTRGYSFAEARASLQAVTLATRNTIRVMHQDEARSRAEGGSRQSLGTVRGRVEMLSHGRGLHFSLYDLVDDAAVTCYPTGDIEAAMREMWGRLADVTGTVRRDPVTDRPHSVRDITSIDLVEEGSRTEYRSARGVLKTHEPAEVLVRRMRDDQ